MSKLSTEFENGDIVTSGIKQLRGFIDQAARREAPIDLQTLANSAAGLAKALAVKSDGGLVADPVRTLSPMNFGATGNGAADDTSKVLAALESGLPVDGGDRIYAVAGTIAPAYFGSVKRLWLKQLDPAGGDGGAEPYNTTVKTLHLKNFSSVLLSGVRIDCGGNFTAGYVSPEFNIYGAGIKIEDCDDITVDSCEVFNGGTINGIHVQGVTRMLKDVTVRHSRVRDMHWSHPTVPADDPINGIWIYNAKDVLYLGNRVKQITGYLNGNPLTQSPQRGRGHTFSLISGLLSIGNIADTVDQGFDHSGSDGVRGFSFASNYARDCASAGFKWANSQRHGSIVGNVAEDCGRFGFIFSPKSGGGITVDDAHMDVVSNRAINPGKPSIVDGASYVAGYSAGFDIENDHPENGMWPKGIRFADNSAHDDQLTPTMQYGLYCAIEADGYGFAGIETINFKSTGHTIAATGPANAFDANRYGPGLPGYHIYGPHRPLVIVNSLAAAGGQNVPNNADTSLDYTTNPDPEDTLACHDHSTNANIAYSPIEGWAMVTAHARFASNATGIRRLMLLVNNVEVVPQGRTVLNAVNGDDTYLTLSVPVRLVKGQGLSTRVYQNSGGTLSCVSHQLTVTPIGVHSSHA